MLERKKNYSRIVPHSTAKLVQSLIHAWLLNPEKAATCGGTSMDEMLRNESGELYLAG